MVWTFFPLVDAVLSQNTFNHPHDLFQSDSSSFDQARCHLNMQDDGCLKGRFTAICECFIRIFFRQGAIAPGVQILFLYLAFRASVILDTSLDGALSPMGLSAPEGTSKPLSTGISGVGKKKDLTVPAPGQTLSQVWFFL